MKYTLTLVIGVLCLVLAQAQDGSHSIKRYSKIHNGSKFIITEYIFEDGHLENYITSLPISELRKLKATDAVNKLSRNIEWDENLTDAGLQQGLKNVDAIENAFNNALSQTELQLSLSEGSLGKIHLDAEFLHLPKERQSFVLINKVIDALSEASAFEDILPLEGVESKICSDSRAIALHTLNGTNKGKSSAELIGYDNVEFHEHVRNDGVFLSNGEEDLYLTHVRAIYNWIFADQFTGWYNRSLILNRNKKDDFEKIGAEGLMGLGEEQGQLLNSIVDNPTFKDATSVVFQQIDPIKNTKYAFEIIDIKPSLSVVVSADE